MTDKPPRYVVGYKKPPLHTRFQKGRSGNPEGGRRHRKRLAALLEEALDRPLARRNSRRPRRPATSREAVVAALVDKSVAGDLRAVKLLLDLMRKTDLARSPETDFGEEDPREFLIREIDRLAAEQAAEVAAEEVGGTAQGDTGDEAASHG